MLLSSGRAGKGRRQHWARPLGSCKEGMSAGGSSADTGKSKQGRADLARHRGEAHGGQRPGGNSAGRRRAAGWAALCSWAEQIGAGGRAHGRPRAGGRQRTRRGIRGEGDAYIGMVESFWLARQEKKWAGLLVWAEKIFFYFLFLQKDSTNLI